MKTGQAPSRPVVLFDGVCNLCNGWVKFLLRHDKKGIFRFGALQSEEAKELLKQHSHDTGSMNSIVLLDNNKMYRESTAILRILRKLNGAWALAYAFIVVPAFVRDGVYRFIAKNRYRWFGQQASCMVPEPGMRDRFI